MIYFFVKDDAFVRCEIYPGRPHALKVFEADGTVKADTYTSSVTLADEWQQVCARLSREGWTGPLGRDPRA